MPVSSEKVRHATQNGVVFVCATCERYREGHDKGMRRDDGSVLCTSRTGCGSPAAGAVFHDYKGPILNFAQICYVCGAPSNVGMRPTVSGETPSGVVIGVCDDHLPLVRKLMAHRLREDQVEGKPVEPESVQREEIA